MANKELISCVETSKLLNPNIEVNRLKIELEQLQENIIDHKNRTLGILDFLLTDKARNTKVAYAYPIRETSDNIIGEFILDVKDINAIINESNSYLSDIAIITGWKYEIKTKNE